MLIDARTNYTEVRSTSRVVPQKSNTWLFGFTAKMLLAVAFLCVGYEVYASAVAVAGGVK